MTESNTTPASTPEASPSTSSATFVLPLHPPGAGGWTPRHRTNLIYSALVGIGAACVQLGAAPEINLRSGILAVGAGAVAAGGTLLGLMSAGTRRKPQ